LGNLSKDETRAQANRLKLDVAEKPDSQDICFVPGGRYADVVKRIRPGAIDPGKIIHIDGTVLGEHDGKPCRRQVPVSPWASCAV
jgi:tRNA-specific 2-thiouridylase